MEAPDTQFLLEFVRPDFLMLRVIARGLILWDEGGRHDQADGGWIVIRGVVEGS
jgi:hypothetical protein